MHYARLHCQICPERLFTRHISGLRCPDEAVPREYRRIADGGTVTAFRYQGLKQDKELAAEYPKAFVWGYAGGVPSIFPANGRLRPPFTGDWLVFRGEELIAITDNAEFRRAYRGTGGQEPAEEEEKDAAGIVQISLRLEKALLAEIDKAAKETGESRSLFVRSLLRAAIKKDK